MSQNKRKILDECKTEGEKQEYYDQHISKVPAGCQACGGPYPLCEDGCLMRRD